MEANIFIDLISGLDLGHPAIIIICYLTFLAWMHGKGPFKGNGNGNGKAPNKDNNNGNGKGAIALSRLEEHERFCEERTKTMQAQIDRRFDSVDRHFDAVDKRFDGLGKRLDMLIGGMNR